jgi:hypothetical protein
METIQSRLNKELAKGKSIAWWARGYYVEVGNEYCPSLKIPIFEVKECPDEPIHQVLIDYLGSMMWINVRKERVFIGWGGEFPPSKEGKYLRGIIESIKN